MLDGIAVAGAIMLSVGLVQYAAGDSTVTLAFAGGLVVLGLIAFMAVRMQAEPDEAAAASTPDWSVTVAAIEQPGQAVAITDRANRLVCANSAFDQWFGSTNAPPRLLAGRESTEELARMARAAWRDGDSGEVVTIAQGDRSWTAEAHRAGRGDDFLIWRFGPILQDEPMVATSTYLTGPFGKLLGDAGIALALVDPSGTIRAVNSCFARRASGDAAARLKGHEFAALLRSDERERIYFAHEGSKAVPQALIHVPIHKESDGSGQSSVDGPSLMLLIEAGAGLGGLGGDAKGQTPQLEALLEQLPLGLAMTDRDGHFLFANPAFCRASGIVPGRMPPYPSDLVIQRDKSAMSDAVRRFGQGAANSGDIAVRLRSDPDEPVSLGLAGVRGLGEAAVLLCLADTTEETRLKR